MNTIRRTVALLALGAVGGCGTADTLAPNTRAGSDKAASDRTPAPPAVEPSDANALAESPSRHLARLYEIKHQERLQEAETCAPLLETLWLTQPGPVAFSSLDLDENGVLNEDDLYSWIDTAERSDQGLIIREHVYDERLDVNTDGAVNPLDFHTLRLDIAQRLAARGEVLEWNGRIVDPAQMIVSSDGASVVTTTQTGYQRLLELAQVKQDGGVHWKDHGDTGTQEGEDHDAEDPCHETKSTGFNPTPPPVPLTWWEEHPMWCYGVPAGTWTYECTIVVSVVYHNQQDHRLTCGVSESTITYSLTHTTGSTLSAEVGSQVEGIVSLGIQ